MDPRRIVTVSEMRDMDTHTLKSKNMTSYALMTQASDACVRHMLRTRLCDRDHPVLVVAGMGNNGGDALVVARLLLEDDWDVQVVRVGNVSDASSENQQAWDDLSPWSERCLSLTSSTDLGRFDAMLGQSNTVIEGLFGIGLARPVEGLCAAVIRRINHTKATVISLDIASGLHADNGLALGSTIEADHTLAIQCLKPGHLLQDGQDYSGELHVIDAGIQTNGISPLIRWMTQIDGSLAFPKRRHNTHKYHYGNVLTIGGSPGMMGAPILAASAAMRTGSGLSRVLHDPEDDAQVLRIHPDLMIQTDLDPASLSSRLHKIDAVLFGPGLGRSRDRNARVLDVLLQVEVPMVVDADGLWYLSARRTDWQARVPVILTPHIKELADLLGRKQEEITRDPIGVAKATALEHGVVVVLKGAATIVTNGTMTWVLTHGHPGLATAGTGDVLAGILLSLLGRGLSAIDAATLGVWMHAEAAQIAKQQYGEESMIASDLVAALPQVVRSIQPH
jgi:NAD(P)H-hydrate epimerase